MHFKGRFQNIPLKIKPIYIYLYVLKQVWGYGFRKTKSGAPQPETKILALNQT